MVSPEPLRRLREILDFGRPVLLKVSAKGRDGDLRFFADDAEPLDKAVETTAVNLRAHVSAKSADLSVLKKRLGLAEDRAGEVTLVAALDGGREVEVKLPRRYALDAALRGAIKTAPGVVHLEDV